MKLRYNARKRQWEAWFVQCGNPTGWSQWEACWAQSGSPSGWSEWDKYDRLDALDRIERGFSFERYEGF